MEQDWFQTGWGQGQYGSRCQVPLPARSCGFSWGAGQDGASSAPVSSPSGQGFVSWRGCESRLEDVSSSPVPLKDEGDLLRKERKSFGEFLHHQAFTETFTETCAGMRGNKSVSRKWWDLVEKSASVYFVKYQEKEILRLNKKWPRMR